MDSRSSGHGWAVKMLEGFRPLRFAIYISFELTDVMYIVSSLEMRHTGLPNGPFRRLCALTRRVSGSLGVHLPPQRTCTCVACGHECTVTAMYGFR